MMSVGSSEQRALWVEQQIYTQKFRYYKDGRKGLRNRDKDFISVKINFAHPEASYDCIILCVSADGDASNLQLHPNGLQGESCIDGVFRANRRASGGVLRIPHLQIERTKKKCDLGNVIQPRIGLLSQLPDYQSMLTPPGGASTSDFDTNKVRLLVIVSTDGKTWYSCYSDAISNEREGSRLEITRLCHPRASARGGSTIAVFTANDGPNITPGDFEIFVETSTWRSQGFTPGPNDIDYKRVIHYTVPAFENPNIVEPVTANLVLRRLQGNQEDFMEFTYTPDDKGVVEQKKRKALSPEVLLASSKMSYKVQRLSGHPQGTAPPGGSALSSHLHPAPSASSNDPFQTPGVYPAPPELLPKSAVTMPAARPPLSHGAFPAPRGSPSHSLPSPSHSLPSPSHSLPSPSQHKPTPSHSQFGLSNPLPILSQPSPSRSHQNRSCSQLSPPYSQLSPPYSQFSPSSSSSSPSHSQPKPSPPNPRSSHPGPSSPHSLPSPYHSQPSPYHSQPSPYHSQPSPSHSQPSPSHYHQTPNSSQDHGILPSIHHDPSGLGGVVGTSGIPGPGTPGNLCSELAGPRPSDADHCFGIGESSVPNFTPTGCPDPSERGQGSLDGNDPLALAMEVITNDPQYGRLPEQYEDVAAGDGEVPCEMASSEPGAESFFSNLPSLPDNFDLDDFQAKLNAFGNEDDKR